MKLKYILFVCFLFTFSMASHAVMDLDTARKSYTSKRKNLDSKMEEIKENAVTRYESDLKKALRSADNAEEKTAIKDELTRLTVIRAVDDMPSYYPSISKARESYTKTMKWAEDRKLNERISMGKQWVEYLKELEGDLVQNGKTDEAQAVREEAEKYIQAIGALGANLEIGTRMVMGDCPQCDGTGRSMNPCKTCSGKGKCKYCGGKGKKKARGTTTAARCTVCKGHGKCRLCKGAGERKGICSRCKGKKRVMVAASSVDEVPGMPGVKMPITAAWKKSRNGAKIDAHAGMAEYKANMAKLSSAYKAGKAAEISLHEVISNPEKHVTRLYVSEAEVISAFARGVVVIVQKDGEKLGAELTPASQKVGIAAEKVFKAVGKSGKVKIIYGVANKHKFVLYETKALK